jgi:hypothetical protein
MAYTPISNSANIGDSFTTINTANQNFDTELTNLSGYNSRFLTANVQTLSSQFYGPTSRFYTVCFLDVKTSGTNGGTINANIYTTRTLNTVISSTGLGFTVQGSLNTNQFTLPQGTWFIRAETPGYNLEKHQIALRNITDSVTAYGTSCFNQGSIGGTASSVVLYSISIATTKTFEIRHRGSKTQINNGLGIACNFNAPEIYTKVVCTEITS